MNKISLERINEKSPYTLKEINGDFEFHTSKGTCYRIYFVEESPIGGCETMQFMLNRVGDYYRISPAQLLKTLKSDIPQLKVLIDSIV